jgi:Tfp pilus assembly protein PilP
MRTITLLLLLTISQVTLADTKGISIVANDGVQIGAYESSYALLVGVSDYTNGWPDLNSVPSELSQVETLLKQRGFEVIKVMNPTSNELEDAFRDFVDEYGLDAANRLLFYFSGHGYTRLNNSKGYLVPVDAPNPRHDEKEFIRKAYSMTNLLALARSIEASHALFLFDSCFSGTIFKTKALPDAPPLITAMTSQPVRQFITAGDAGEEVPAKSVFTPAFIDALKYGIGDLNKDGYVTGSELGMFLQNTVANSSNQTPQYGKINDYELSRGDYVFLASLTARSAPSFSLGDITNQANEQKQVQQDWVNTLQDMRNAYQQVQNIDQDSKVSAELKVKAWLHFQNSFSEDNPASSSDNDMLSTSRKRMLEIQMTVVYPPKNHTEQLLERFDLDSIELVGTMDQSGAMFALMQTPDGSVHRVQVGDYLGKNWGKVDIISGGKIDVIETVSNSTGGWKHQRKQIEMQ